MRDLFSTARRTGRHPSAARRARVRQAGVGRRCIAVDRHLRVGSAAAVRPASRSAPARLRRASLGRRLAVRAQPVVGGRLRWVVHRGWMADHPSTGQQRCPLHRRSTDGAFDADHPWAATVRGGVLSPTAPCRPWRCDRCGRPIGVRARRSGVGAVSCWVGSLGRAVRTRSVHPMFPFTDATMEQTIGWRDLVPARLVVAGVALIVVGGVLAVARSTRLTRSRRRPWTARALLAGTTGVTLLILLVGVPTGVVYGRRTLAELPFGSSRREQSVAVLGALWVIGVVVAAGGSVRCRAARRSTRRWMTLARCALAACGDPVRRQGGRHVRVRLRRDVAPRRLGR